MSIQDQKIMGGIQSRNEATKTLETMRKRLLDLTARNRLINFRHTKGSCLRIIDEIPNQLVETLLNEREMRFLPVPEPTRKELIEAGYLEIDDETGLETLLKKPTAEEWAKHLGLSTKYEIPEQSPDELHDKHSDDSIQTLMFPYELEVRLNKLMQTS